MLKALTFLLLLFAPWAVRAGDIPQGYRGLFSDGAGNLSLELKEDKAIFSQAGQTVKLPVVREPAGKFFTKLTNGKAGLFIEEPAKGVTTLQAFAVIYRDAPVRQALGLTWRAATVYHFTLQRELSTLAPALEINYSDDGLVTLDATTLTWQIGWGPAAQHQTLQRVTPAKAN